MKYLNFLDVTDVNHHGRLETANMNPRLVYMPGFCGNYDNPKRPLTCYTLIFKASPYFQFKVLNYSIPYSKVFPEGFFFSPPSTLVKLKISDINLFDQKIQFKLLILHRPTMRRLKHAQLIIEEPILSSLEDLVPLQQQPLLRG
jgi:hypothetical protein